MVRILIALSLLLLPALPAQAEGPHLFGAEATITNTRVLRFTSAINGTPFTLFIRKPSGPAPKGGYSVLYVLDGDLYFPMAQFLSYTIEGTSPVVVGIGHEALSDKKVIARYAPPKNGAEIGETDAFRAFGHMRTLDFTPAIAPQHRAPAWLSVEGGGDVDAFLRIIETEIKPKVAALVPVNTADQAIYGHSLGGLAVTRALFTEPTAFRTFIASSPSLWWDGGAVLKDEAGFAAKVRAGKIAPRILITAAGDEADQPPPDDAFVKTLSPDRAAEIAPYLKMRSTWPGMKTGSRALADRLKSFPGKSGYEVRYELIPGVDHGSAPKIALMRAMDFAFPELLAQRPAP